MTSSSAASAIKTAEKIKSLNPSQPSQIVGIHQKAARDHVEPAMQAALASLRIRWSRTTVEERAGLVCSASADLMRQRKMEYHGVAGFRSQQELG